MSKENQVFYSSNDSQEGHKRKFWNAQYILVFGASTISDGIKEKPPKPGFPTVSFGIGIGFVRELNFSVFPIHSKERSESN